MRIRIIIKEWKAFWVTVRTESPDVFRYKLVLTFPQ
jgi:hypothetical protein